MSKAASNDVTMQQTMSSRRAFGFAAKFTASQGFGHRSMTAKAVGLTLFDVKGRKTVGVV